MAPTVKQLPALERGSHIFLDEKVTVVFVLGGPGAGEGTQCANLVRDYNLTHACTGDLLRSEQERPDCESAFYSGKRNLIESRCSFGQLIKDCIKDGRTVPTKITAQLLVNEIIYFVKDTEGGEGRFIVGRLSTAV